MKDLIFIGRGAHNAPGNRKLIPFRCERQQRLSHDISSFSISKRAFKLDIDSDVTLSDITISLPLGRKSSL